ncbi:hypothetical protein [Paracraurococcus ruber]|uniref:N-acetyltransferase domain-containing protein n=1 Tax=Paracraurococcus ruber TaxID=77675 RepID=A0ABS1CXJ9_9PROT|nr:hypothetical protein [Paracraurococcus ruber]MBK1659276.1 hypothetical protein [Paracraurococcus ruber]TDG31926.1 hypothetical protein E2C05_09225 [Paracraurococcus ruber]
MPWLRIRRLTEADRPALAAHLAGLEPRIRGRGPDQGTIAECCAALDFRATVLFAAMAGNAAIAVACGATTPGGETVVTATEDASYRQRGLAAMLDQQVRGAGPAGGGEAAASLQMLMRALGGADGGWQDSAVAVA